jgi:hypothetical protein
VSSSFSPERKKSNKSDSFVHRCFHKWNKPSCFDRQRLTRVSLDHGEIILLQKLT